MFRLLFSISNCQAVACPEVADTNAVITYSDPLRQNGSSVTITCNAGYVIQPEQTALTSNCQVDGTWSPDIRLCNVIDCGSPEPGTGTVITYENAGLGESDYGQVAVYACKSGKYFPKSHFLDSAETVKVTCIDQGIWNVSMGYATPAASARQFKCFTSGNYEGCLHKEGALASPYQETSPSISTNKQNCLSHCRNQNKLFAFRQGDECYCLDDHQPSQQLTNDDCNTRCHDGLSFCGGNATVYSVYSTLYPCVDVPDVDETQALIMYSATICIQFCRGDDQKLAFYRAGLLKCNCMATIPEFIARASTRCTVLEEFPVNTTTGEIYSTDDTNFIVYSCEDIFDEGVFYHGNYYLTNGSKIYCNFLDGSANCDKNWVAYKKSCYRFQRKVDKMDEQFAYCRSLDSLPVSVGDENEWAFISKAMTSLPRMNSLEPYIGLYDTRKTFSYMWSDETAVTFRKFAGTYPKNIGNRCVNYVEAEMKNVACEAQQSVICERSSSAIGCARLTSGSMNLLATNSRMSIPWCFESCRSAGFNYSITRNTSCSCENEITNYQLIGWSECDLPCPSNKYQLCGGQDSDVVFITEDNHQDFREGCRAMILGSLLTNVTVEGEGDALQIIDCAAFAGDMCPESWLEIGDSCYRFFPEAAEDPDYTCMSMGGYLAVYETQTEADNVMNVTLSTPMLAAKDKWLFGLFSHRGDRSARLRYSNGAWVNVTTRDLVEPSSKRCFAHSSSDISDLSSTDCDTKPYICEMDDDYRGCYKSPVEPETRVIDNYENLDVFQCFEACKITGKPFIGTKNAQDCYCVEESDLTKAGKETDCPKTCCYQQSCGNTATMSVYTINYNRNASSCEELFNQGVLMSGQYILESGVAVWCGMKDSPYLKAQAEACTSGSACEVDFLDVSWTRVGINGTNFAVDVQHKTTANMLKHRCDGLYQPATIVAPVRFELDKQLITDVLKWNLDSPDSIPAYVGLCDQFYMGSYTWSDGSLFRVSDIGYTEIPESVFLDPKMSTFQQIKYDGSYRGLNDGGKEHVVCQRDTAYLGCYEQPVSSPPLPESTFAVSGYSSMSLSLCRQLCQGQGKTQLLISSTGCICYEETGDTTDLLNLFTKSNASQCEGLCPANQLQRCGGSSGHFRRYTFEEDIASSCQELHDNFVILPKIYNISGSPQTCGVDDVSTDCPAGFIARRGKCYRFQRRRDQPITAAAEMCFNISYSYLASPTNQTDVEDILGLISEFTALRSADLWAIGYMSVFGEGRFTSAVGHMINEGSPIAASLNAAQRCVALNVTSGQMVPVSCSAALPFICETSNVLSGCALVNSSMLATPVLSLPHGMTVHQCIAYCKGFGLSNVYALARAADCTCIDDLGAVRVWNQFQCHQSCTGQFTQLCGSSLGNIYSIYVVENYRAEHIQYSCDDLLTYGVVEPATYVIDTSLYKTCFKYSALSDLFLGSVSNLGVSTSSSSEHYSSSNARMKLKQLTYNGWMGETGTNVFIEFDLKGFYVIEGIVMRGNIESFDVQTDVDNDLSESHPDNPFQVPETDQPTTWIALSIPVVARNVKIVIRTWNGTQPKGSFELVGYLYSNHDFNNHYLGCHGDMSTSQEPTLTGLDYTQCRTSCKELGYPYVGLQASGSCQCLKSNTTRDFFDVKVGGCSESCFDGVQCPEPAISGNYTALYTTADLTCPLLTVNNSDVTIQPVASGEGNDSHTILTTLIFNCHPGYDVSGASSVSTKCYNFQTYHENLATVACARIDCGPFRQFSNADLIMTDNNSTLYGDTAVYRCVDPVKKFNGREANWTMTCEETGQWSPEPQACTTAKCLAPPTVLNSDTNGTLSEYVYDTVISYQCYSGYVFVTDSSEERFVTCLMSGDWTTVESSCERSYCTPLPPSITSSTIVHTSESSVKIYRCDPGMQFEDKQTEKITRCSNITFQWDDIASGCEIRSAFATSICLTNPDTRLVNSPMEYAFARSMVDCALLCWDKPACTRYNYLEDTTPGTGIVNCHLFMQSESELMPQADDSWDIFTMDSTC